MKRPWFLPLGGMLLLLGILAANANYQVTQGSGTTFLSRIDISGAHAPTNTIADGTNPDQAACVDGSGNLCTVEKNSSAISTSSAAIQAGTGAVGDSAWSGSGNSTIIAALKAIYSKTAGVLETTDAATGATGAAVPTKAGYAGVQNSSGLSGIIACDATALYDASTNGATQLVGLVSGKTIYVCGYTIMASGTVNVEMDYGTGTACATGNNKIVPAWELTAQTGVNDNSSFWSGLKTAASTELCIKTNGAVAVQALVHYTQF